MTSTRFEDRLLAELRSVVAERPAPATAPPARPRTRAPRALLGGTALAAAVAAAVLVVGGGDPAAPAFALERQADGDVTVTINRFSDADGLERELREAGIPAVVDYTPPGKTCREPRGQSPARTPGERGASSVSVARGGATTFTISRGTVRPGQTLVVTTSGGAGFSSVGTQVVAGKVSSCQVVDSELPAPPPPVEDRP